VAVSLTPYNKFVQGQLTGSHFIDFDGDTIKLMLTTSSYTPDKDTHEFKSSVTNEVSGTNYTAGGNALAGKTVGLNTTSDFIYWDATDLTFTNVTITFRYGVLYKDTGTAGTSALIAWIDFGANQAPSGIDFLVQWPDPTLGAIIKFQN
jgi:hypothetical protein